jgi:hypothetical protein
MPPSLNGKSVLARRQRRIEAQADTTLNVSRPVKAFGEDSMALTINAANLNTTVTFFKRRQLTAVAVYLDGRRKAIDTEIKELAAKLSELGDALLAATPLPPNAIRAAEAMNAWKSDGFRVERVNPRIGREFNPRTHAYDEIKAQPQADVVNRQIPVLIRIVHHRGDSNMIVDKLNQTHNIKFTDEMVTVTEQIISLQVEQQQAIRNRTTVEELIANVANLGGAAVEAMLTLAHLQGRIKSTDDISQLVVKVMHDSSDIPMAIRELLTKVEVEPI